MPRPLIVIDGPAGAGKSSAARELARRLGYSLLDTGAIYRAVALLAKEQGISWSDADALATLARGLDLAFTLEGETNRVWLGDRELTTAIRAPQISQGASQVSALPPVRAALLDLQRRLGQAGGVVAEGRDMGTVVFPGAEVKFFLTASPETRATRRYAEEKAAGRPSTLEETLEEMRSRDARDAGRKAAPLRQAADALLIDSTGLGLAEVLETMLEAVQKIAQTPLASGKVVDKLRESE